MTKDLRKEKMFAENTQTTLSEMRALANELLSLTWTVDIYRHASASVINLRDRGWRFEFNSRKRAAGLCDWSCKTIYLSEYLLRQNLHKSMEFENTIRHELAHALDFEMRGKSDHSRVWKAVAREVLCTAERCYTSNEIGDSKSKYTLVCDSCGYKKPSHKIKKRLTACGNCCRAYNGGRFSHDFVLRQVQNY